MLSEEGRERGIEGKGRERGGNRINGYLTQYTIAEDITMFNIKTSFKIASN